MSIENKLIPELRFPEFMKDGEWEIEELNQICEVFRGGVFSKVDISEDGKQNCIHYGQLFTKYTETIYKVISKTNRSDGFRSKIGDVLMPSSDVTPNGLVKASAIMLDDIVLGGDMNILRPKVEFNSIFLSYLLNYSKEEIIKLVSGTTVKHIYPSQIINCQLPITNFLPEQQKIANCLSSLDEVITAHTNKLETLKTYKKGLMQNLFPQEGEKVPKLRFKEFEKNGEWMEKKLKNVFSIYQGYAFSSQDSSSRGVRWLKIADVGVQKMKKENPTYLPTNYKEEFEKFLVKKGDFVLALTRPILNMELKIAKIDDEFNNSLLNQRVGKIITSNDINFVYYVLHTKKMVVNINKNIEGNDPPNLSFQQIENILVNIPIEIREQKKIADTLSSLDVLIKEQANKIEELKLHKKGLMQGLFPKVKA